MMRKPSLVALALLSVVAFLPSIAEGAAKAGRSPSDVAVIVPSLPCGP